MDNFWLRFTPNLLEHHLPLTLDLMVWVAATLASQFSEPWLRAAEIFSMQMQRRHPSCLKLHWSAPFGGINLRRIFFTTQQIDSDRPFHSNCMAPEAIRSKVETAYNFKNNVVLNLLPSLQIKFRILPPVFNTPTIPGPNDVGTSPGSRKNRGTPKHQSSPAETWGRSQHGSDMGFKLPTCHWKIPSQKPPKNKQVSKFQFK